MLTQRANLVTVFAAVLLAGLLLPQPSTASTQTVLASLTITGAGPTDLTGVVITHNPGFEKTVSQGIPPYTVPVFVDQEVNDMTGQVVNSRFLTTVLLTNTTGGTLNLTLTITDAGGTNTLATIPVSLPAHATTAIDLSEAL
jgi:hypothetical protein